MIGGDGARGRQAVPHLLRRQDVEDERTGDRLWAIERHPVGDPCAAVVTHDLEARVAEFAHGEPQRLGHGALGIGAVAGVRGGAGARAIARQVGDDERAHLGQPGSDFVPADVSLGVAVQQQERWALAADPGEDVSAAGLDELSLVTGVKVRQVAHRRFIPAATWCDRRAAGAFARPVLFSRRKHYS